jgi:hypothetical protein
LLCEVYTECYSEFNVDPRLLNLINSVHSYTLVTPWTENEKIGGKEGKEKGERKEETIRTILDEE